jgi:hypothetical protein
MKFPFHKKSHFRPCFTKERSLRGVNILYQERSTLSIQSHGLSLKNLAAVAAIELAILS